MNPVKYFCIVIFATLSVYFPGANLKAQNVVPDAKNYEFRNGLWFDGKGFKPQTFYSVNATLTRKKPSQVADIIDLKGGFVVPPFGDAHCHHLSDKYGLKELIKTYQEDGVFYAQTLCNPAKSGLEVRPLLNLPNSVDVVQAQACFTGNNSHPMETYESLALGLYSYAQVVANKEKIRASRLQENNSYFIVDTEADLNAKWEKYLATKPQILKVILLHSENYAKRKAETGDGGGIDPALLPKIVSRAHKSGLRVAAHVDSEYDYHAALVAGVDVMAHLPGYFYAENEKDEDFALTDFDIAQSKKRGVVVIPTSNRIDLMDGGGGGSLEQRAKAKRLAIINLKRLKEAGVKIAIGTDLYGKDSKMEAFYLRDMRVFSNLELLRAWCTDTPQSIFPKRRIGLLKEGYEASFLVLTENPIVNFDATEKISVRFKGGQFIDLKN